MNTQIQQIKHPLMTFEVSDNCLGESDVSKKNKRKENDW
jgi:hypothetical protein